MEDPMRSTLSRHAALAVALLALVLSFTGWAEAARKAVVAQLSPGATVHLDSRGKIPKAALPFKLATKPKRGAVLRLGKNKRFPAGAIPRVRDAARLAGRPASAYRSNCPEDTVDRGTWCLMNGVFTLDRPDIGKNDYAFAEQACGERGGYLPTAGQLVGSADAVKLSSTIDDKRLTAAIDEDPSDGLKDLREMSSTLVTVSSGSSAAGSIGVSQGSKGDPRQGEPDPIPVPADPFPSTLQYVTVFDNGNKGGFAGSKPVGQPERFRCAFNKTAGSRGVEVARVKEKTP
jgi:hypothetical protein